MQVILLQDVKSLGKKGEMVKVSEGYARNFLFPKKIAQEANAGNINNMNTQKAAKDFHKAEEKAAAEELKSRTTVTFKLKAGAGGKMFGSVTAKEISEELKKLYSIDVDKKKINLPVAVKSFGQYTAEVKLYPEVSAKIKVFATEQD